MRWAVRAAAAVFAVGAATAAALPAHADPAALRVENPRSSGQVVDPADTPYQYAPAVLAENGRYRMWWCSQSPAGTAPGDDILYAEADSPNGPFHAPGSDKPYQIVFQNDGGGGWDGQHVCDPSVVKVGGRYLMYFSGAPADHGQQQGSETSIGVAESADGISWHALSGSAIVTSAHQRDNHNNYGAGQPSVTYRDGKIYLLFTDTTAAGALPANGAGQFAYRSADPTFASGVEVATKDGWQPRSAANDRQFSVANAFSADWQYSDALSALIVAHNNDPGRTTLDFLSADNPATAAYAPATVPSEWSEGPGLVSTADKHAITGAACNRVPVDVVQSTGKNNGAPATLRRFGADVVSDRTCDSPSPTPSASAPASTSPSASPSHAPSSPAAPRSSSPAAGGAGGGGLPVTGSPVAYVSAVGALLLAAGAVLFVIARRRRRAA
ncbi:hypothetical protein [Actinocatenispora rupis]|uniref:hypothetical protein n=1 Tax=Actinocatenispora rupis TaxID=519421 RepID=UPI0019451043|nr:hypothetical protein [Actinocatenispora rupis]